MFQQRHWDAIYEGWSSVVEEKLLEQEKWWHGIRAEAAADGIIQEDNTYAEAGAIVNRDSLSGYLNASSIACVCLFTVLVETVTWQTACLGSSVLPVLIPLLEERDKMLQAVWKEEKQANKRKQQQKKTTVNNVKLTIFSYLYWNLCCQRQVLLELIKAAGYDSLSPHNDIFRNSHIFQILILK